MTDFTTPRTWVTDEFATAAMLNTHIRDNLLSLYERVGGLANRNAVINGDFRIWQKGASAAADRWGVEVLTATGTPTRQALTNGAIVGASSTFCQQVITSGGTSGSYVILRQRIEAVETFAGQQVTVSFWAKAASGTPKIGVEFQQRYGAGTNSPSASVSTPIGAVTLSTSWQRFQVTATVPSISGKVIGDDGLDNDSLSLNLWLDAGTTYATRASSIGNQAATFQVWGVQVEQAAAATAFEVIPWNDALARCQRFYYAVGGETAYQQVGIGTSLTTTSVALSVPFPVAMRIKPTPGYSAVGDWRLWTGGGAVTATSIATYSGTESTRVGNLLFGATGPLGAYQPHCVQANNTVNARLTFDAEIT